MVQADLIIEGAAEVVTCAPSGAGASGRIAQSDVAALPGGAVACAGERIVFVGTEQRCRRDVQLAPDGRRLDARGGVVLPGFVDPHTHLPFAGWREKEFQMRLAGASYLEIAEAGGGIVATVRSTRACPTEDLAALVRDRLDAMLLAGTTTVEAKSGYGLSVESEISILRSLSLASDHPMEIVPTFLGAHVVAPEFREGRRAEYVRLLVEDLIPRVARERLARFCDVFVDEGAFTLEEAREILQAAARHGLGLRAHAEQLTCTGAAMLASSLGALSVDHLERLTEADALRLAEPWVGPEAHADPEGACGKAGSVKPPEGARGKVGNVKPPEGVGVNVGIVKPPEGAYFNVGSVMPPEEAGGKVGSVMRTVEGRRLPGGRGTVAVLLPGAAHFLRETARPPARALIEAGVPVALGTDFNPGTSPCLAIPPILNLACLLFGLSPDEAIVAATRHAALSLGLEERIGSLEAGKQADLVVWDVPDRRHLAYRFGPIPCVAVVKRGRIVAEDGVVL